MPNPLAKFYPKIQPLHAAINSWLATTYGEGEEEGREEEEEEEEEVAAAAARHPPATWKWGGDVCKLLRTTLVASHRHPEGCPLSDPPPVPVGSRLDLKQRCSLGQVLDKVTEALVREKSPIATNALRMGLKKKVTASWEKGSTLRVGMEGHYSEGPNTLKNEVRLSPVWGQLHSHVGDDVMFHLFRWHSIFLKVTDEDCYLQLAGPCVAELYHQGQSERLSARCANGVASQKLLYSACYPSRSGLPASHVLNRAVKQGGITGAQMLVKEIFQDPKKNLGKKRMRKAIPLFIDLMERHHRCKYARILNRHCPLPEGGLKRGGGPQQAPRLGNALVNTYQHQQEEDTQPCGADDTPCSLDHHLSSCQRAVSPEGHLCQGNDAPDRVQVGGPLGLPLGETICGLGVDPKRVKAFIWDTLLALFPPNFWGNRFNLRCVVEGMTKFATTSQYGFLDVRSIVQGIKINSMTWLLTPGELRQGACPASLRLRTSLLTKLVWWVAEDLCCSLVRTQFYVTEAEGCGMRLVYYRKDLWSLFQKSALAELEGLQYRRDPATSQAPHPGVEDDFKLPHSLLRLVPKSTGYRTVANLSIIPEDPQRSRARRLSANGYLRDVFWVLQYETRMQPFLLGYGLNGLGEVFAELKKFVLLRRSEGREDRQLYFVSCDIANCFDSILQEKLLLIAKPALRSREYIIQKHTEVCTHRAAGKCHTRWVHVACPVGDLATFRSRAALRSRRRTSTIFTDSVGAKSINRDDLLRILENHIMHHGTRLAGNSQRVVLKQLEGIAQGSVLSTLLCNMYYGHFENEALHPSLGASCKAGQSLLMRLVDDFLLITEDKQMAEKFFETMHAPCIAEKYGIHLKHRKTKVNFTVPDRESILVKSDCFDWCGFSINQATCSVSIDMKRVMGVRFQDSIIPYGGERRPGESLIMKIKAFINPRCDALILDTELNSVQVVLSNIHDIVIISAFKTCAYIRGLPNKAHGNCNFVEKAIREAVDYLYNLVQCRTGGRLRGCSPGVGDSSHSHASFSSKEAIPTVCSASKEAVSWIGLHAFSVVLRSSDRQSALQGIGLRLQWELNQRSTKVADVTLQDCKSAAARSIARSYALFGQVPS